MQQLGGGKVSERRILACQHPTEIINLGRTRVGANPVFNGFDGFVVRRAVRTIKIPVPVFDFRDQLAIEIVACRFVALLVPGIRAE